MTSKPPKQDYAPLEMLPAPSSPTSGHSSKSIFSWGPQAEWTPLMDDIVKPHPEARTCGRHGTVAVLLCTLGIASVLGTVSTLVLWFLWYVMQQYGLRSMAQAALVGHQIFYGMNIIASSFKFNPEFTKNNWHRPRLSYEVAAILMWSGTVFFTMWTFSDSDEQWREQGVDLACCGVVCIVAAFLNNFIWILASPATEALVWKESICMAAKKALVPTFTLISAMVILFLTALLREHLRTMRHLTQYVVLISITAVKIALDILDENSKFAALEATIKKEGGMTPKQQEMACEKHDTESFGVDFVLMISLKIAATAVPTWQAVLGVSVMQLFMELAVTKFMIWKGLRAVDRAQKAHDEGGGDGLDLFCAKVRLTMKMVKYLSDMLLEYFAWCAVIFGGVLFRESHRVTGFGSFTPMIAVKILAAQVIPELFVDCLGLTMIRQRINIFPVYRHIHRDIGCLGVKSLVAVAKMMYVALAVIVRT